VIQFSDQEIADERLVLDSATELYYLEHNLALKNWVVMRFDRVRTPDNQEFRACILGGGQYGALVVDSRAESRVPRFMTRLFGEMVERWPDPNSLSR
jgi:hypothetical protein